MRAKDSAGREPLHAAASNPNAEAAAAAVTALMAAGADLNGSAADGRRPLHLTNGNLQTALLLVRLGASLMLRNNSRKTAFQTAAAGSAAAEAALRQACSRERHCAGCGAGGEHLKRCSLC